MLKVLCENLVVDQAETDGRVIEEEGGDIEEQEIDENYN
jgi:hypothetical protein